MTQDGDKFSTEDQSSETSATDALQELRKEVFSANPGRGAVKKATEAAGASHDPVQRAISLRTIQSIREVERWLSDEE